MGEGGRGDGAGNRGGFHGNGSINDIQLIPVYRGDNRFPRADRLLTLRPIYVARTPTPRRKFVMGQASAVDSLPTIPRNESGVRMYVTIVSKRRNTHTHTHTHTQSDWPKNSRRHFEKRASSFSSVSVLGNKKMVRTLLTRIRRTLIREIGRCLARYHRSTAISTALYTVLSIDAICNHTFDG